MGQHDQGFHKLRPVEEEQRLAELGAFIKEQRSRLGLSQEGLGQSVRLSQVQISRIERGEHLPRQYNLERLANALELQDHRRSEFFKLAGYAVDLPRNSSVEDRSVAPLVEEYARMHLELLRKVRIGGDPLAALRESQTLVNRLSDDIPKAFRSTPRNGLLRVLGEVLDEQGWAYGNTSLPGVVSLNQLTIAQRMRGVATECGEKELFGKADLLEGDAYYCAKEYAAAIPALERALGNLTNELDRFQLLRSLAGCWSHFKQETKFLEVERRAMEIAQHSKSPPARSIASAMTGFARARRQLGVPGAYLAQEEAWRIFNTIEGREKTAPICALQLMANDFDFVRQWQPSDRDFLQSLADKALQLACASSIPRYIELFKRDLDQIHNYYSSSG